MLRVHFLNVGHGDCTIIKHPSGRLTMVDINRSQDYDRRSFDDLVAEEAQKLNPIGLGFGGSVANALLGETYRPPPANALGAFTAPPPAGNALRGLAQAFAQADRPAPANALLGLGQLYRPGYYEALAKAKSELTDPIAFLRATYPNEKLWRFVLTHPDLDHMRGLKRLHDAIGFYVFWDTNHTKPTPEYRSGDDKVDWEFYQALRNDPRRRRYHRGDALFAFAADEYGNPGGDNIQILSPTPALVQACNSAAKSNDLSIVLRLWHAGKSILLPGDAEKAAWESMVLHFGQGLKSDFLKASHHGRDTGYNLDAVKLVAPLVTFVSVGRKPDTDASSKYRQQCNKVASTRYHGNMELRIHDDGRVEWFVDRNVNN
jgi:beta-lactamase superfamily II metal-dependent hydrolase